MKSVRDAAPIGVFDSGIGGLTVVREILRVLPTEDIVYLGDTARVPYGIRSPETVMRYALECTRFLLAKGIKLLVIACNTVSAVALDEIMKEARPVPVIGVIGPGARAASRATKNSKIGVIGTEAAIKSGAYQRAIGATGATGSFKGHVEVITRACPLFVPLVEEGWLEGPVPELVASSYLSEIKAEGIDTLVLGCTHYPLLKPVIAKTMGAGVALIDSATETAEAVRAELESKDMKNIRGGLLKSYVTDDPGRFKVVGERFLAKEILNIEKVALGRS